MTRQHTVSIVDGEGNLSLRPSDLEIYRISAHIVPPERPPDPGRFDAVIINANDNDLALNLARQHTGTGKNRPPAILISDQKTPADGFDGWLRHPVSPVQLANRIQSLRRLWVMEDVARRRCAAAKVFGHASSVELLQEKRPTVLFVGQATSRFMAVRHALSDAETSMIAAFSSFSAFDYLHERPFDAVILNAIGQQELAFTISSAMRRNARLYHTPVLLLTSPGNFDAADEAFARGVSDILPADASAEEIGARVLRLADERGRRRMAKAALEYCRTKVTLEKTLGLYQKKFALAHLQDLLRTAALDRKSTGLVLLSVSPPDIPVSPGKLQSAYHQFASMLRHLLRAEDCPAVIESDLFAAILPYTSSDGARCVAERISAVAECTAFDGDDPLQPFRLKVECAALEAVGEETAEALIERGLNILDPSRLEAV